MAEHKRYNRQVPVKKEKTHEQNVACRKLRLLYVRLLCGRVLPRLRELCVFCRSRDIDPVSHLLYTQAAEDAQASSAVLIFERRSEL